MFKFDFSEEVERKDIFDFLFVYIMGKENRTLRETLGKKIISDRCMSHYCKRKSCYSLKDHLTYTLVDSRGVYFSQIPLEIAPIKRVSTNV